MSSLQRQIVTDEDGNPVAVQIAYNDWLYIERKLGLGKPEQPKVVDLSEFAGTLPPGEDALEYQQRIRKEWD
ncbi:MAG: hypothetical protein IT368_18940 [Candidatus Hydrogenedentes bacterium]|nr:hypothetical protein [Candidatus Hydrogenedentota bacterium]